MSIDFLAALLGFITLLGIGVLRRWRWTFWLILVGFLAEVLGVLVAILQLIRIWQLAQLALTTRMTKACEPATLGLPW